MKILGIDDCNRGSVLGSMIIAGYLVDEKYIWNLKIIGVRDSKSFTKSQIKDIYDGIKNLGNKMQIIYISASEISDGENLNDLECRAFCRIAQTIGKKFKIMINNFDYSKKKFIGRAERLGFHLDWKRWSFGHNNESRDMPVGAASIVAKHHGNLELDLMRIKFGKFGSGNPNDEKTCLFIRNHINHIPKCNSGCEIIRWNWSTIERLREMDDKEDNSASEDI